MNKKGLELPINMIVVIAIAVLVLVVVAAVFSSQIAPVPEQFNLELAFAQGCSSLRSGYGCDSSRIGDVSIPNFKQSGSDIKTDYKLTDLCELKGMTEPRVCATACGCAVTGSV